jgi:methylated-DNA-[protein]-cysteine S-methyltransferase
MAAMNYTLYSYPKGELILAGSPEGLSLIHFLKNPGDIAETLELFNEMSIPIDRNDNKFHQERKLFDRYFSGKQEDFRELTLHFLSGTPYQKRVWEETRKIPHGRTVSYKTIAHKFNHKGYRSVGQALGKNPIAIIVPCHRVVGSDGSLTGFGGGLEIKKYLISLEKGETRT